MTDPILVQRDDRNGVCTLTLNRPDKLNAINPPLFRQFRAHLDDIAANGSHLGVVVLRGAGRSFCAGHDLGEIGEMSLEWLKFESLTLELLSQLPQVVIAAVHGHCMTGGLELALAADFIVCAESASFADTHAKWGLVPAWGGTQRLPRRVGTAKAIEIMSTCRRYNGREAERMGLANACFSDDEFDAALQGWTAEILGNSWHSLAANKRLIVETDGMTLREGLAHELIRSPGSKPRNLP